MSTATHLKLSLTESLTYSFTKSKPLLESYYTMRAQAFASVWKLKNSISKEDILDKVSDILVVQDNQNNCVAGARLTVHKPSVPNKLSFEVGGFSVVNVFPERELHRTCYGEISRFAISEEYRDFDVCVCILKMMAEKGKEHGCECFVVVSPLKTARFFKRVYASVGYKSIIHRDINVPDRPTYEGIRMCVMVIELKN